VEAEDELGRLRVTQRTLRPAGEVPRLLALAAGRRRVFDRERAVQPARLRQRRVGLLVVPDVGVAAPVAVAVLLRAGDVLGVGQARLQTPAALRVALLRLQKERLDRDGAVREAPAGRGAGGRLRVDDVVVDDLGVARDRQEALLRRPVRPELGVDR